jgi:hypothetical protein
MTPNTTNRQPAAASGGDFDDIYKRLVGIHQALAEPTNAELPKVVPWALTELMALIRDVDGRRKAEGGQNAS